MNKALELIQQLIKEHETSGYCTDYEQAQETEDPEQSFVFAYDVGRYETLTNLYNELKRIGE